MIVNFLYYYTILVVLKLNLAMSVHLSLPSETQYPLQGTRRTSKRASGWLVVHISEADTTVHVMDEEVCEHCKLPLSSLVVR